MAYERDSGMPIPIEGADFFLQTPTADLLKKTIVFGRGLVLASPLSVRTSYRDN